MRDKSFYKKNVETDYPIDPLVAGRWSPYVFAHTPVEPDKLRSLFEAARWAPSSYNEQPWSFIIARRGEAGYERILSTYVEFNQNWAGHAPIIGISVAHVTFAKNGKPNRHAYHDVGLAMGGLLAQATALGLSVHQMAGFDVEKARQVLELPEGYDPVAAFAIGYLADPASAEPDMAKIDTDPRKGRRSQNEFLFSGTFGKPLKD